MAENRISLINAAPRLNVGLEKTPGQNCRIVNKRRGCLIEKIQYLNFRPPFWRKVYSIGADSFKLRGISNGSYLRLGSVFQVFARLALKKSPEILTVFIRPQLNLYIKLKLNKLPFWSY